MYDLVIRSGRVIDGTGAPARVADVAVVDGRVVEIGPGLGRGAREVDATDLVVAPGFIDLHTHYDAQLGWDPAATPSPFHGTTTVIGGNCGFTIAPLTATDDGYLLRMLARVEGMSVDALAAGLAWDWSSYAEWLGTLEGNLGVNAGFLVGHSAIRRAVMGDAALGEQATEKQTAAMVHLLGEALSAGGLGLSTSRAGSHHDGEGRPVPSRFASRAELLALCAEVRNHPGTQLEAIVSNDLFTEDDMELMAAMSRLADRPLNWNVLRVEADRAREEHQLGASDYAAARGATVKALTFPEPARFRMDLATAALFAMFPGWSQVMTLPLDARAAALRDPATRERLLTALQTLPAGSRLEQLADFTDLVVAEVGGGGDRSLLGRTLGDVAAAQHVSVPEALFDLMVDSGFDGSLTQPVRHDDDASWERRAQLWDDPRTIVGASDAGAHLDTMCCAGYTTNLVGPAVRDRGLLTLERAVQILTGDPATFYGLHERGILAAGKAADLVLFDPDRVGARDLETRRDLPGSAARLYAEATGVEHVFVNGTALVDGGALTDARTGQLLRSGRDTHTVPAQG